MSSKSDKQANHAQNTLTSDAPTTNRPANATPRPYPIRHKQTYEPEGESDNEACDQGPPRRGGSCARRFLAGLWQAKRNHFFASASSPWSSAASTLELGASGKCGKWRDEGKLQRPCRRVGGVGGRGGLIGGFSLRGVGLGGGIWGGSLGGIGWLELVWEPTKVMVSPLSQSSPFSDEPRNIQLMVVNYRVQKPNTWGVSMGL